MSEDRPREVYVCERCGSAFEPALTHDAPASVYPPEEADLMLCDVCYEFLQIAYRKSRQ